MSGQKNHPIAPSTGARRPSATATSAAATPSLPVAVLTDLQFWAPVVVLAIGVVLLAAMK